jgi:hypothetical protein
MTEDMITFESTQRSITQLPYDQRAVSQIANLLGVAVCRAPFQLPGGKVHQLTLQPDAGRPALMLTLWPSIRRVDAIGPGIAAVFTNVSTVDLVQGVEVLFRRNSKEFLIVTCGAKVIVRA